MTEPTTVADEIAAMRRIVAVLDKLDPDTRRRVVGWLRDRYSDSPPSWLPEQVERAK